MKLKKLVIFADGGAKNNPGLAGVGLVFYDERKKELEKYQKFIGEATNNQAEYQAVIEGLKRAAQKYRAKEVIFYLDSQLVAEQLNHKFKIKNANIAPLFIQVHNLSLKFNKVKFFHIPREKNKIADKLVREAIKNSKFKDQNGK